MRVECTTITFNRLSYRIGRAPVLRQVRLTTSRARREDSRVDHEHGRVQLDTRKAKRGRRGSLRRTCCAPGRGSRLDERASRVDGDRMRRYALRRPGSHWIYDSPRLGGETRRGCALSEHLHRAPASIHLDISWSSQRPPGLYTLGRP